MWYHQIRRFCPNTPIILVGCKNDTRFIYKDEQYLSYCKERSPLVRYVIGLVSFFSRGCVHVLSGLGNTSDIGGLGYILTCGGYGA